MTNTSERVRKSTIYTRTGDTGLTSLYNGDRRPKNDPVFVCVGTIDELNASLGMLLINLIIELGLARTYIPPNDPLTKILVEIQERLLDLGSHLATPISHSKDSAIKRTELPNGIVETLEKVIDQLDSALPKLTKFILPSGCQLSAHLHLSRTICRRAEITMYNLPPNDIDPTAFKFINRLSDLLFVMARYCNHTINQPEEVYKKANTSE